MKCDQTDSALPLLNSNNSNRVSCKITELSIKLYIYEI